MKTVRLIDGFIMGLVGFLLGAMLITETTYRVTELNIEKAGKLCQPSQAMEYTISFDGTVVLVFCNDKTVKKVKLTPQKPES